MKVLALIAVGLTMVGPRADAATWHLEGSASGTQGASGFIDGGNFKSFLVAVPGTYNYLAQYRWRWPGMWAPDIVDQQGSQGTNGCTTGTTWEFSPMILGNETDVFYISPAARYLRRAYTPPNATYTCQTLDAAPGVSLAHPAGLAYAGLHHVFYTDTSPGILKLTQWTGSNWQTLTLDGPGSGVGHGQVGVKVGGVVTASGNTVAAVVYNVDSTPRVYYYDQTNKDLRVAWWNGAWNFTTIDGAGGSNGEIADDVGSDIAAISIGVQIHIFYRAVLGSARWINGILYPIGASLLRHMWWDGSANHIQWVADDPSLGGVLEINKSGLAVANYLGEWHVFFHPPAVNLDQRPISFYEAHATDGNAAQLVLVQTTNQTSQVDRDRWTSVGVNDSGFPRVYYYLQDSDGVNRLHFASFY